jgi:YgiT-type zinc finger domain-containing protein
MICLHCKTGTPKPGKTNVMLEREGHFVIIKNVPADVCSNCGEYYLSELITDRVLKQADIAFQKKEEVQVLQLKAA